MSKSVKHDPPFHAEHIGSLLRPPALMNAYRNFKSGKLDAAALKVKQDECIREVVRFQEELGLPIVTDGEFRRTTYISHFVDAIEGLDFAPSSFQFHDPEGKSHEFVAPTVTGKLRRVKNNSGEEFEFLKSVATREPKSTLPSPATMHFLNGAQDPGPDIYADNDTFFSDLAQVYQEDIRDLEQRGARYIQLDDVPFAMLCDPALRKQLESKGQDPEQLVDRYIELTNACVAGGSSDSTFGFHICRGNLKGTWLSEGSYQAVAEKIFHGLDVDVFFLEYDTPRAGDFAPLSAMPQDKVVVLGLVSSKVPELEDGNALRERITEASAYVPLDRLGLSPQCGFSSAVVGNPVTVEDQRAKLALVVQTAATVWGG